MLVIVIQNRIIQRILQNILVWVVHRVLLASINRLVQNLGIINPHIKIGPGTVLFGGPIGPIPLILLRNRGVFLHFVAAEGVVLAHVLTGAIRHFRHLQLVHQLVFDARVRRILHAVQVEVFGKFEVAELVVQDLGLRRNNFWQLQVFRYYRFFVRVSVLHFEYFIEVINYKLKSLFV